MGQARGKMCPKFGRHRRGFKKLSRAVPPRDGIYCASGPACIGGPLKRRGAAAGSKRNIGFCRQVLCSSLASILA